MATANARAGIVELRVSDPDVASVPTVQQHPDAEFAVEGPPVTDTNGDEWLFVRVTGERFDGLEATLEADPTVREYELVAELEQTRTYGLQVDPDSHLLTPKMAELGSHLLSAVASNGSYRYRILLNESESFVELLDFCESNGLDCSLESCYSIDSFDDVADSSLSTEQRRLLRRAAECGYFDVPRDCSQEALAEEFDVCDTTISIRIREALGTLVEDALCIGE
jgi:hypothetical protein